MDNIPTAIWFDDITLTSVYSQGDLEILEQVIAESFNAHKFTLAELLVSDKFPRIIFISISQNGATTVFYGQGLGLINAFENVFNKILQRYLEPIQGIIKIDIVTEVGPRKRYSKNSRYDFVKGIEGIAFAKEFDLAILPEQIGSNYLWNDDLEILSNRIENYLEKNPPEVQKFSNLWRADELEAYSFRTTSYLLENNKFIPLFRGQFLFEDFTNQDLRGAINMAGKYLINAILPGGRYEYQYHVDTNYIARDYNFLRHAGTTFSLLEYLEFSKDINCLPALKRAVEYMKLFAFPGLEDNQTICFPERGLVKVGGNGLAALALAKYIKVTGDDKDKILLAKICNWICEQTKENGDFRGHKQYYHNGKYSNRTVLYYPGEVIYGLVLSYSLSGEEKWLDVANRIAHWMINIRDKGSKVLELEHDHWLLYGLNELHRITRSDIYIEHTIKICKAIMHYQILTSEYPDYIGGHNNGGDPSSTQAATRAEGLIAAYKLLRDFGNVPEFAAQVLEYAERSICFQLRTQYTPTTTIYVHDIARAMGGFRGGMNSHEVRIDYVQHNISSLIAMHNLKDLHN